MALLQLADTTVGEEVIESIRNSALSTLAQTSELQGGARDSTLLLVTSSIALATINLGSAKLR